MFAHFIAFTSDVSEKPPGHTGTSQTWRGQISISLACGFPPPCPVSILPVFKCGTGCVPEAGSNSQRCPSDPCPSKLWQKELLFSHRPGGPCPPGEASPRDWQLRKHRQPRGDGVRAQRSDALVLPPPPPPRHATIPLPPSTPDFSSMLRSGPLYFHLIPGVRSHLCWSEVMSNLAAPCLQLTTKQPTPPPPPPLNNPTLLSSLNPARLLSLPVILSIFSDALY